MRSPTPRGSISGQGRNRTADTAVFSRVLYQLSYLAKKEGPCREARAIRLRETIRFSPGGAPPFHSNSGGGIRTRDLRVMSPTSYQAAPPRSKGPQVYPWPLGVSTLNRGRRRPVRRCRLPAPSLGFRPSSECAETRAARALLEGPVGGGLCYAPSGRGAAR